MLPDIPRLAASTAVPDDPGAEEPRTPSSGRSDVAHAPDVLDRATPEPVDPDLDSVEGIRDQEATHEEGTDEDATVEDATVEVGPDGLEYEGAVSYHAVELGAGRPVVFLHDLFASSEAFRDVVESLADDWRCLALDLPGHGRSTPPDDVPDLISFVDDVAGVLEVLDATPAAVVGHGSGGVLAALLTLTHPSAVSMLVLVAADPRGGTVAGEARRYLTRVREGDPLAADDFFHLLYGSGFFRSSPSLANAERERFDALDATGVGRLADLLYEAPDVRPQLASIEVPVLFVAGDSDRLVSRQVMEAAAEAIPGASFDVMPEVGHGVPVEAPRAFGDLLDRRLLELWG